MKLVSCMKRDFLALPLGLRDELIDAFDVASESTSGKGEQAAIQVQVVRE